MTDMGAMRWCLGIEVIRDRVAGWIKLSQAKYFRDVLTGYGLVPGACRTAATPAEAKTRFTVDSAPSTDKELRWSAAHLPEYRKLVGQLIYGMIGTRPDIAWAVSQCSRFFSGPSECHMIAASC